MDLSVPVSSCRVFIHICVQYIWVILYIGTASIIDVIGCIDVASCTRHNI